MTFNFIKAYQSRTESFKMDIPVSFVIPKVFKSFDEMGVLSSNNKEVCDLLTSLGVTHRVRHQFRITKNEVIVHIRDTEFESIKKILLRDKLLKELGL